MLGDSTAASAATATGIKLLEHFRAVDCRLARENSSKDDKLQSFGNDADAGADTDAGNDAENYADVDVNDADSGASPDENDNGSDLAAVMAAADECTANVVAFLGLAEAAAFFASISAAATATAGASPHEHTRGLLLLEHVSSSLSECSSSSASSGGGSGDNHASASSQSRSARLAKRALHIHRRAVAAMTPASADAT